MCFMHYYYPLNIIKSCLEYHIYFVVEDWYIRDLCIDRELNPGPVKPQRRETPNS